MTQPSSVQVIPVTGIPSVKEGDDLARLIIDAARRCGLTISGADIVVVAQKVVSKAEGALVDLRSVTPGAEAVRVAGECLKDPRLVEVILGQTARIVRLTKGVLIVETHHGLICANGGVDASNVPDGDMVTLLPKDPDASARRIRDGLAQATGHKPAVIVSDTFNRPWREGSINVAIGVAGVNPLIDMRGQQDEYGRVLKATVVSLADEVATAAQLVMKEVRGNPAAVVRGVEFERSEVGSRPLLRDPARDLFR